MEKKDNFLMLFLVEITLIRIRLNRIGLADDFRAGKKKCWWNGALLMTKFSFFFLKVYVE